MRTTGLRVREFAEKSGRLTGKQRERKKPAGGLKYIDHACMHVWGGAGIPLELQLTQTQKKHSSMANTQSWDSCAGTTSLGFVFFSLSLCVHIPPKYRPLARSQEGIWDSIISTQSNTSSSTCCQRWAYQTDARCHLSLSALDRYSFWR